MYLIPKINTQSYSESVLIDKLSIAMFEFSQIAIESGRRYSLSLSPKLHYDLALNI